MKNQTQALNKSVNKRDLMLYYKKVSVITVAHNCARFLTTAFKSFAYQDYKNMEWIIVNDASTDSTARHLQKYRKRDTRVKLCLNTTEKGLTDSYEFAITKASGDYIAFLEPENFWIKDKISRQVGFMDRFAAPLSHTSYAFADDKANLLPAGCCHIEKKVNLLNFRKETDICLSTFMMNREEIKDLFPRAQKYKNLDLLMYLMQKGLTSQGMSDVLSLCRPKFDTPMHKTHVEHIHKISKKMAEQNISMPNLFKYQIYKASNIVNIKLDPSTCIDRDVSLSLDELRKYKL